MRFWILTSVLIVATTLTTAFGQEGILDDEIVEVSPSSYQGDPINIEGYQKPEAQASDRELQAVKSELKKQKREIKLNKNKSKSYKELAKTTEKLADTTEEMYEEKKESQKLIDEYNNKLDCLQQNNFNSKKCRKKRFVEDRVGSYQSAPVRQQQQQAVLAPKKPKKEGFGESFALIPGGGMNSYSGDFIDFESNVAAGLRFESPINDRFTMGVGLNYVSMDIIQTPSFNNFYFGNIFPNGINMNRELNYTSWGASIYGKVNILTGRKFRPYLVGGVGYFRSDLDFTTQALAANNFGFNNGFNNGIIQGYQSNNINGNLGLGIDADFTDNFGLNFELGMIRTLTSSFSQQNASQAVLGSNFYNTSQDQFFLEQLGLEIDEANILTLSLGIRVIF